MTAPAPTVAELLAAAEPTESKSLAGLVERLEREGRLRGARDGGRPIGPRALGNLAARGVTNDSRHAGAGAIFVAVPGGHVDGHEFVASAASRGAAVAIVERPVEDVAIAQLVVDSSQRSLAAAACWWYADPSHELGVVGITGTDGKTTTSFLAVAALEAAGVASGLMGTVDTKIGRVRESNPEHATTPDAPALQLALRAMVVNGNAAAVVETTSHGLALDRVGGVAYDAAILTNLTHEHLEFHGTWEAYRDAKLSLFERLRSGPANPVKHWPKSAIVNVDDPSAGLFAGVAQEAGARVVTYGTDASADVRAGRVEEDARRLRISYTGPSGAATLELHLAGRFNVHNALAVVALGEALSLDAAAVRAGLEAVDGVPGRMERIEVGQPFGVVVDFAHSPASLQAVLDVLAPSAAARGGELIAVFGSAGERDTAKRPVMGRVAGERCRLVVVTDEDPRGEDREAILDEIAAGAQAVGKRRGHDLLVIADRRDAIDAAFERARPGDVVLLAGKGHERSILGPDGDTPWNERQAALDALAALGYSGGDAR
ncbi:MAG TPA: UDP-N-acetylmuramoyl-L-alanyl-D-glutamate--2,6-diaminopimelate ligase [Candidatus Limnocylindrales bacterium]|nr:UDP-N-acetylmuramoyl-L-alanyl-D-glutamate--2,6-diaminopimelate ligase [Candidatus Limnocylindrales bacterium]